MRLTTCLVLISWIVSTAPGLHFSCMAQSNAKPSSIDSLNSNALLGDSFNDKDFGKLPTHITSDTLTLHAKTRVFVYKGNVVVKQGDMTLTSNEIEGNYNEQNQIQKIIAKGDVVITKQDIEATSQRATYDAVSSIITLTDNPQLQQEESVLIADRIKILLNENRSMAEGNVRVTFVKKEGTPSPNTTPQPVGTGTPSAATVSTGGPSTTTTTQSSAAIAKDSPTKVATAQGTPSSRDKVEKKTTKKPAQTTTQKATAQKAKKPNKPATTKGRKP